MADGSRGLSTIKRTMREVCGTPDAPPANGEIGEGAAKEISVGDVVSLPVYGEGRVKAVEDDKLLMAFAGGGTRKFRKDFAGPQT